MSGGLGAFRERLWWSGAPTASDRLLGLPLLAAEGLFRAGVALRAALLDAGIPAALAAPVPVISVGNLAVGGAGKTPVTLAVAGRLRAMGRRPGILSRGYGAQRGDDRVVADGEGVRLRAAEGGDEPVMMARRLPGCPVLCGPERARLAGRAASLGADVLLLDDGFQHRRLRRDLDVVVLDAANPFGNGHCLPYGPNREPASALRRAGLAWLTHADRAASGALERLRAMARDATGRDPVESCHAPRDLSDVALERSFPLARLAGRRVGLLTGVARPGSVRRTVEALGATVVAEASFPDHHRFDQDEVEAALRASLEAGAEVVVTTEKDAVRLPGACAAEERLRVLRIDAEVTRGEEVLAEALRTALAGASR